MTNWCLNEIRKIKNGQNFSSDKSDEIFRWWRKFLSDEKFCLTKILSDKVHNMKCFFSRWLFFKVLALSTKLSLVIIFDVFLRTIRFNTTCSVTTSFMSNSSLNKLRTFLLQLYLFDLFVYCFFPTCLQSESP